MGAVRKISIALTEQLAADVDRAVESGQYASTSEVIRDALRAWSHDRERRVAELRQLISEADASGPPIEGNFDYEDIIRRGRERLAAERSPG